MKSAIGVINTMVEKGVIGRYAIAGAVAALNYVEPSVTEDLDVLISFDEMPAKAASGLVTLQPILDYLREAGYSEFRKEGVVIEDWPVQFLPVSDPLDAESLEAAIEVEIDVTGGETIKTRILCPEHVVAAALRTGRARDFIRIHQFLDEDAVGLEALRGVFDRHHMRAAWSAFCVKSGLQSPLW